MACYSPLRAIVIGKKNNGKKLLKIIPESKFNEIDHNGVEYINIPCGHCIGCRLKYSRIWADRCMAEASYYDSNLFVTLTYDNEHLPLPLEYIDEDTGLITESHIHPLVKRDVQLFIKRLRKRLYDVYKKQYFLEHSKKGDDFNPPKFRYFACGEYGSQNMRPHYHIIFFGLELDDLQPYCKTSQDFRYFISPTIEKLWCSESEAKLPFEDRTTNGFHIVTTVNWNVCAYVARYILKKQYGENSQIYADCYYPPEFTLMSRKPGIGRQFYEDNKERLYNDEVYVPTEEGARRIKPNRYYDSLYDIDYPEDMENIREQRKAASLVNEEIKKDLTDKSFLDRIKSEETVQQSKLNALRRKEL